jgi:hypothetical protein
MGVMAVTNMSMPSVMVNHFGRMSPEKKASIHKTRKTAQIDFAAHAQLRCFSFMPSPLTLSG